MRTLSVALMISFPFSSIRRLEFSLPFFTEKLPSLFISNENPSESLVSFEEIDEIMPSEMQALWLMFNSSLLPVNNFALILIGNTGFDLVLPVSYS